MEAHDQAGRGAGSGVRALPPAPPDNAPRPRPARARSTSARRVVVALSGGVDSSVAAALLVEQGYEVVAVMARLWSDGSAAGPGETENRCCAPEAVDGARRVASLLDIPFYLVNLEAEFRASVVDPFVAEYARGRTPNPCIQCNRHIRFRRLLQQAAALEAGYLATGHYARVENAAGRFRLCAAADEHKDQSYVLYTLGQEELGRVLFPLGGLSKAEVRELARRRKLPAADRPESMDLCFVADGDWKRFLRRLAPEVARPGPILDTAGHEIGRHPGLAFFTVGQRRGIGIGAPAPLYVIRLDVARNAVVVGPARELGRRSIALADVHYPGGRPPQEPAQVRVKVRYRALPAPATWTPTGSGTAEVTFDRPVRDPAPGQSAVAYRGDVVLGGGIICE